MWYEGAGTTDKRWLIPDERGSVVAVTNSTGAAMSINAYDEYGIPQSTNIGRFGYTGQTWLPEIGMNYYKARMYSPTLGRFMQSDPIGYKDGVNWYDYVDGDPVNRADPTGLRGGHECKEECKGRSFGDTILIRLFNGYSHCNVGFRLSAYASTSLTALSLFRLAISECKYSFRKAQHNSHPKPFR